MAGKGPEVSPLVATAVITLLIGGVAGYFIRTFQVDSSLHPPSVNTGMTMSGPAMTPGGGGPGGGQGQAQNGMALARLVRNLSTVQKVQNKGLTPQQASAIAPILKGLQTAEKITDKDAEAKIAEIEKTLTDEQKKVLQEMAPAGRGGGGFGGGGGGGFGGGGAGRMASGGGAPGGGGPGGPGGPGGMGGGGRPDPEKPFASERNKQALDDLVSSLGGS